jgi:hypothetical protein
VAAVASSEAVMVMVMVRVSVMPVSNHILPTASTTNV